MEQRVGDSRAAGPEIGPDPRQEFLERERFDQVVVRAEVESLDPVGHPRPGAQHQDGDGVPALPQAPQDHEAVEIGQPEIEDDERDVF